MTLAFYIFETKRPEWVEKARAEYAAKLNPFIKTELIALKSPAADRDAAEVKLRKEAEILLKNISERDFLVLFDESGKLVLRACVSYETTVDRDRVNLERIPGG